MYFSKQSKALSYNYKRHVSENSLVQQVPGDLAGKTSGREEGLKIFFRESLAASCISAGWCTRGIGDKQTSAGGTVPPLQTGNVISIVQKR